MVKLTFATKCELLMANCRWGIWNCLSEHLFRSSVRCMISTSTLTSPQMERKTFCFISLSLSQHISFCLFIIFATLLYLSYSLYTSVLSELLSKWNLLNVLFLLQLLFSFEIELVNWVLLKYRHYYLLLSPHFLSDIFISCLT